MISDAAFDSLRMAATLAVAVPSVGVRISSPLRPLIDVSWIPGRLPPAVRHMPPCMFRRCIACAHHRRRDGQSVGLLGLPPGLELSVEVLVAPGDRRLPSGIYQVRIDGNWRVVFTTLVPPARAADLLAGEWPELCLHADSLTGASLVCWQRTGDEGPVAGEEADRVVAAQARLMVEELVAAATPAPRS